VEHIFADKSGKYFGLFSAGTDYAKNGPVVCVYVFVFDVISEWKPVGMQLR